MYTQPTGPGWAQGWAAIQARSATAAGSTPAAAGGDETAAGRKASAWMASLTACRSRLAWTWTWRGSRPVSR